jgi:hypothetical protein
MAHDVHVVAEFKRKEVYVVSQKASSFAAYLNVRYDLWAVGERVRRAYKQFLLERGLDLCSQR